MKREIRNINTVFETRSEGDNLIISGRAISYDAPAKHGDFVETINRGSFKGADDILATYDHNDSDILGRTSANTIKVEEREDGIWVDIYLNKDDSLAKDVYARAKRHDLSGFSFEFICEEDEYEYKDGVTYRNVKAMTVFAVNPVVTPFYDSSKMYVRGLKEFQQELEERKISELNEYHSSLKEKINEYIK